MATKKPTKKPAAKKAAGVSVETESFIEYKRNKTQELLTRDGTADDTTKQKLLDGSIRAGLIGVESGRSDSAIELLLIAIAYLRNGNAPPEDLCSWLVSKLEAIAEHDVPWGIPLLRRRRGQGSADEWAERWVIAAFYDQRRRENEKHEVAWRDAVGLGKILGLELAEHDVLNYWRKHYPTKSRK